AIMNLTRWSNDVALSEAPMVSTPRVVFSTPMGRRNDRARGAFQGGRMAHRKPRPTIREENKRALLEAAESIFAEHGFAGATTAAIAKRAGVPKANLHYYFATKEALYRAVVERVLTAWLAAAASFA